jgi:molybdate transport repressor ModE-like protein
MKSSRSSSPSSRRVRHPARVAPPCPNRTPWGDRLRARASLVVEQDGGPPNRVLGPRFVLLLEGIQARGSVRGAAREIGLGYRHAVAWIQCSEAALDRPLVVRRAGGVAGGGAGLTLDGIAVVRAYRRISRSLDRIVARAERSFFPGARGGTHVRS